MKLHQYPTDFNLLLHQIRLSQMRQVRAEGMRMVSVGCNGREYFDVIHQMMGTPDKHIGLEAYLPKPASLPPNVDWIASSASQMDGVENDSVDLVFAGQTVEHLWERELCGFLLESSRVLVPGGRLVIDSPNHRIADLLKWNHPEHTLELRPADAVRLVELAGLRVDRLVGHWLCEAGPGLSLPLHPQAADEVWSIERRVRDGIERPDESFSWWLEATKVASPRAAALIAEVRSLWVRDGDARLQRMMQTQSPHLDRREGVLWAHAALNWQGALVFGPHAPLPAGSFLIEFTLDGYEAATSPGHAEVFVNLPGAQKVLATIPLPASLPIGTPIVLPLTLPATTFGLEFRLWSNGTLPFNAKVAARVLPSGL